MLRKQVAKGNPFRTAKIAAIVLPLLCLALPSVWLMMNVSPLWRDVDAYVQLTYPPGQSTILLHGPLYCELARVPLWMGHRATGGSMHLGAFMKRPRLTDAGIAMLLLVQHLGFCLSAFYLISALATSLTVRLILAAFIASHSMFYAFAHCLGSETLSMITILLLVGLGIRMLASFPNVKVRSWSLLGLLLVCSILTRHINAVLAGLFPLAFVLSAIAQHWSVPRKRSDGNSVAPRFREQARACGISVAVGVAALLVASGYTHLLCRKAHINARSEFGVTFVWRLDFLTAMPVSARASLLEKIADRVHLADSRKFLAVLQTWVDHHSSWDPVQFLAAVRTSLGAEDSKAWHEHFDRVLNDVAAAFLSPPVSPLPAIAFDDFARATSLTEGDMAGYLFSSTDYVNTHRDHVPQVAGLITFRNPIEQVMKFQGATYFHLWNFLSFRGWCIVWSGAVALLCLMGRGAPQLIWRVISYAAVLCAVGLLMTLANCFFAQIMPRFALPMFELLLLSLTILLGTLLSAGVEIRKPADPRLTGWGRSRAVDGNEDEFAIAEP